MKPVIKSFEQQPGRPQNLVFGIKFWCKTMPSTRYYLQFNCCSVTKSCPTLCDPWAAARQASVSFSISCSLFEFISVEPVMPSNHLILCHPPFSCLQSFPAPSSFPVSQLFESGGQSIRASASVLPMNIQCWFPLGLTSLISLFSKGLKEFSLASQFESINSSALSFLYGPHHICTWLLEKP